MTATLSDVAKRAGVSTATASRVLNKKMVMPIPQTTIQRIEVAALDLGYRPNAFARALVTRKTNTLGLFTEEMTDPHFAQMLEAVEAKARALGYHLVVSGDLEGIVQEGRVDGVIMLAAPTTPRFETSLIGKATVFVWSISQPVSNCIAWSDFEGAYQCGRYLLSLGHRRIAAIFGDYPPEGPPMPKVAGFRKAMQESDVFYREMELKLSADQFENGYLSAQRLLQERQGITGVFARNDFLALGAIKAVREVGLTVPQDMSVLGYNDTMLARCADPPLTSVRTPIAEAGTVAVEQLVRTLEGGEKQFPGRMLPTTLTIRGSCAPPGVGKVEQSISTGQSGL